MSFEEFVRAELDRLLGFAVAVCADREIAQDVVQEVLLRAHGRWPDIVATRSPEAYVRRMVVNEYLSWRRKWSRVLPVADVRPDAVPDVADRLADRDALIRSLATLPPAQRAATVLRYFAGFDDLQIASTLGCRPATARGYISRALSALRIEHHPADDRTEVTRDAYRG